MVVQKGIKIGLGPVFCEMLKIYFLIFSTLMILSRALSIAVTKPALEDAKSHDLFSILFSKRQKKIFLCIFLDTDDESSLYAYNKNSKFRNIFRDF